MRILGIETSCDETAAAVVDHGTFIRSNIVASQVDVHKKYGGVVPELACRKHIENMVPVVRAALDTAQTTLEEIDAIAVTQGPGLIGALLIGLSAAKALAYATHKPLIPVHHIEGHIYSLFLSYPTLSFPFLSLIVSGGHTELYVVWQHGKYQQLGRTLDDAAGEAFDKVAKMLHLGYPGGPIIDTLAAKGDPTTIHFPRPYLTDPSFDFSFSGLKTAVRHYLQKTPEIGLADLAASFQQAVVDVLVTKALRAIQKERITRLTVAGGVGANSLLRKELTRQGHAEGIEVYFPPRSLCTDNAAMIATAGYYCYQRGQFLSGESPEAWELEAVANLPLSSQAPETMV
jgi:N6-L-threonylcarbamoyladenine synthase